MNAKWVVLGIPFLSLAILLGSIFPHFVTAQDAGGGSANPQCNPWNIACPCGAGINPPYCNAGGPNKANCPPGICKKIVNGYPTLGICTAPGFCHGVSSSGGGGELGAGQQLLQMAKQIADMFKGGGGGGGGGGGAPPPSQTYEPPGQNGCTSYYAVTTQTSDPCAIYTPSALSGFDGSSISDSLLNALGETTPTNVSEFLVQPKQGETAATTTATTSVPGDATNLQPDLAGNIKLGNAGATIYANLKEGITEIAGFFGATTLNAGQSASLAGRMCANRPWAGGLLSKVIPTSFFDGLCRFGGYQVGLVTPSTGTPTAQVVSTPKKQAPPAQNRVNAIEPKVDVWAEPGTVRLGTRTYIFWTSEGVDSCKVEGPNFSHNTLSGGASTVPITDATIYSIECNTPDGSKVTDSVTVNLKI